MKVIFGRHCTSARCSPFAERFTCAIFILDPITCLMIEIHASDQVNSAERRGNDWHENSE